MISAKHKNLEMRNHLKVSGRFIVPSFSVIFKAKDSDDKLIYITNDDKQINLSYITIIG